MAGDVQFVATGALLRQTIIIQPIIMENINKTEKHKRAFIIWLAIYPLVTIIYYLLGSYLMPLPLILRTLVLTAIAVPVMFYFLVPLLNKLFGSWLK